MKMYKSLLAGVIARYEPISRLVCCDGDFVIRISWDCFVAACTPSHALLRAMTSAYGYYQRTLCSYPIIGHGDLSVNLVQGGMGGWKVYAPFGTSPRPSPRERVRSNERGRCKRQTVTSSKHSRTSGGVCSIATSAANLYNLSGLQPAFNSTETHFTR